MVLMASENGTMGTQQLSVYCAYNIEWFAMLATVYSHRSIWEQNNLTDEWLLLLISIVLSVNWVGGATGLFSLSFFRIVMFLGNYYRVYLSTLWLILQYEQWICLALWDIAFLRHWLQMLCPHYEIIQAMLDWVKAYLQAAHF